MKQTRHWSLIRMLCWPLRSSRRASSRLPGGTRRLVSSAAACNCRSLRRATRSIVLPARHRSAVKQSLGIPARERADHWTGGYSVSQILPNGTMSGGARRKSCGRIRGTFAALNCMKLMCLGQRWRLSARAPNRDPSVLCTAQARAFLELVLLSEPQPAAMAAAVTTRRRLPARADIVLRRLPRRDGAKGSIRPCTALVRVSAQALRRSGPAAPGR